MSKLRKYPAVLIADADASLTRSLKRLLSRHQYKPLVAEDADQTVTLTVAHEPEILIIDLRLPDIGGLELCKKLRTWVKRPIIMMGSTNDEAIKIRALDLGADDFVSKPFGSMEFAARLRAILRRYSSQTDESSATFSMDGITIDFARSSLTIDGEFISLTPIEFEILSYLVCNKDQIVTRQELMRRIWGSESENYEKTLRVHVSSLRSKIQREQYESCFIRTEPCLGYRFCTKIDSDHAMSVASNGKSIPDI